MSHEAHGPRHEALEEYAQTFAMMHATVLHRLIQSYEEDPEDVCLPCLLFNMSMNMNAHMFAAVRDEQWDDMATDLKKCVDDGMKLAASRASAGTG